MNDDCYSMIIGPHDPPRRPMVLESKPELGPVHFYVDETGASVQETLYPDGGIERISSWKVEPNGEGYTREYFMPKGCQVFRL